MFKFYANEVLEKSWFREWDHHRHIIELLYAYATNSSTVGNQKHCFELLCYNVISVAEIQEKSNI